ncbi:hypothetical protein KCU81_g1787, partial [Aureobasidium melanogenum]
MFWSAIETSLQVFYTLVGSGLGLAIFVQIFRNLDLVIAVYQACTNSTALVFWLLRDLVLAVCHAYMGIHPVLYEKSINLFEHLSPGVEHLSHGIYSVVVDWLPRFIITVARFTLELRPTHGTVNGQQETGLINRQREIGLVDMQQETSLELVSNSTPEGGFRQVVGSESSAESFESSIPTLLRPVRIRCAGLTKKGHSSTEEKSKGKALCVHEPAGAIRCMHTATC